MKAIGKPSFVTHNGNIVVRGGQVPPIYAPVSLKDKNVVGKVSDVIGPVSNPYIIIKPSKKGMKVTEELYVLPRKPRRKPFARAARKKG